MSDATRSSPLPANPNRSLMRRNAIPLAILATYVLVGSLSTFTHPSWAVIIVVTATLGATWFYNAPRGSKGGGPPAGGQDSMAAEPHRTPEPESLRIAIVGPHPQNRPKTDRGDLHPSGPEGPSILDPR